MTTPTALRALDDDPIDRDRAEAAVTAFRGVLATDEGLRRRILDEGRRS